MHYMQYNDIDEVKDNALMFEEFIRTLPYLEYRKASKCKKLVLELASMNMHVINMYFTYDMILDAYDQMLRKCTEKLQYGTGMFEKHCFWVWLETDLLNYIKAEAYTENIPIYLGGKGINSGNARFGGKDYPRKIEEGEIEI